MKISKIIVLIFIILLIAFLCYNIFILKEAFSIQNGITFVALIIAMFTFFGKKEGSSNEGITKIKEYISNLEFTISNRRHDGFNGINELNNYLDWGETKDLKLHRNEIRKGFDLIEKNVKPLSNLFDELLDELNHRKDSKELIKYLKKSREGAIPKLSSNISNYLKRYYEDDQFVSTLDKVHSLYGLSIKLKNKLK